MNRFSSRRRLLLTGAAGFVALGAAGTYVVHSPTLQRARWIENVVRKNLPGIRLDEASLSAFVQEVLAGTILQSRGDRLSILTDQAMPALSSRIGKFRDRIERLERLVLTEFLLGSNFFRVGDRSRELITYHGRFPACDNPFAVFAAAPDSE